MMPEADARLVAKIVGLLRQPMFFRDVLVAARDHALSRDFACMERDSARVHALARDEFGRYWLEKQ